MKVLIAGGAGFIGSTIASACVDAGISPVIVDNLGTGRREFTAGRAFYQGDIADAALIDRIFTDHPGISAAVQCAALIVVPDSVTDPVGYYRANVVRSLEFCPTSATASRDVSWRSAARPTAATAPRTCRSAARPGARSSTASPTWWWRPVSRGV